MKQCWEIKKIKDICEKASSNIAQNKITSLDGDYPVYGASGFVQNVDFYHRDTEYLGIVKDGSGVGRVNIYPAYSSLLGTLQYIIPKQGYSLNFVAYALKSLKLADFASGAAIPHIYFKDYGEVAISVPSLTEQERIVEVLDREFERIDALKANAEQNLQHAKDLFQSALKQELQPKEGWEKRELQNIAEICLGLTHTPKYVSNGIPFVSVKDISGGELNLLSTKRISVEEFDTFPYGAKPQVGDVLFCRVGTIGKPLILRENKPFGIFVSVGFLRPDKYIVTSETLRYWMLSPMFEQQVRDNVVGSTLKNLNTGWLKKFVIYLPTIEAQNIVVHKLDSVEKHCKALKENYTKTIALCDDMKQALLRKAFNGEL